MYSYEEFGEKMKEWLEETSESWLGENEFSIRNVLKPNRMRMGISCEPKDANNKFSPTIYLEEIYDVYKETGDFYEAAECLKSNLQEALVATKEFNISAITKENVQENVIFYFLHTEQNRELLEKYPHREFLNLSIAYKSVLDVNDEGMTCLPIDHKVAEFCGLDEESLYACAYENTKQFMKPLAFSLTKYVQEYTKTGERPDLEMLAAECFEEPSMYYVVSNRFHEQGAISILYPELLQNIANKHDCNLYLIPASIDEMLVLPEGVIDIEKISKGICEMNQLLSHEDVLSNDVYKFDAKTQEISQLTNTDQAKLLCQEPVQESDMEMKMA